MNHCGVVLIVDDQPDNLTLLHDALDEAIHADSIAVDRHLGVAVGAVAEVVDWLGILGAVAGQTSSLIQEEPCG